MCVMFNICAKGLTLQKDYKSFPTKVHGVFERLWVSYAPCSEMAEISFSSREGQLSPLSIHGKPEQSHVLSRQLHRVKKSEKYKIFSKRFTKVACSIAFLYFIYIFLLKWFHYVQNTFQNIP